jgi:hypothetical protein
VTEQLERAVGATASTPRFAFGCLGNRHSRRIPAPLGTSRHDADLRAGGALRDDGLQKVRMGRTSMAEIARVIGSN